LAGLANGADVELYEHDSSREALEKSILAAPETSTPGSFRMPSTKPCWRKRAPPLSPSSRLIPNYCHSSVGFFA
jgi:hypothetical protein